MRQPSGVGESIAAGVPGLSEGVPARIDRFGEVVTREGGPVRRAADPFNVSSVKEDTVARELDRLGVKPDPAVSTDVRGGAADTAAGNGSPAAPGASGPRGARAAHRGAWLPAHER